MIETLLRFSLFGLSLAGYAYLFVRVCHFPKHISWIAACCLPILVLSFVAYGPKGWLIRGAWVLFGLGLLLCVWRFWQERHQVRWGLQEPILLWFYGYFALFVLTLLHSHLTHYDNFSHWATIVKFLYTQGQLPTAADAIISFTSYPLGSSLFVTYTAIIVGYHENVLLIGQLILIFCSLYSFFAIIRDPKRKLAFALIFTSMAVFNYFNIAIRMNNLLVDFILPVLTLAGIAGLFALKGNVLPSIGFFLLIGASLDLVKNSAVFFLLILGGYLLVCLWQASVRWRQRLGMMIVGLAAIGLSVLPAILWNLHVKANFPKSKHEVSVTAYKQIFGEKDSQILQQITDVFVKTITDVATISTQGILLIQVILLGSWLFVRFIMKKRNPFFKELLLIDGIIGGYYLGIYAMFLFSMPTDEALSLAGFDRYASSIVILALGLMTFFMVRGIDHLYHEQAIDRRNYRSFASLTTKKIYQYSTLILLFFATLLILSENNGMRYTNREYAASIPAQVSAVTGDHFDLNEKKYLVVSTNKEAVDSYLVGYVGKYYLFSPNVDGRENFLLSDAEFRTLLKQYDEVVVLEEHYTFNAMTKKLTGKTFAPGVYSVAEVLGR